jgi:TetR/AcrR family transcriptional regulator
MAVANRRAQERARRKEEILQAARTVFAAQGWHRATVDAVAERAEVSKGTIYLYFESKEAILAELVLQALAQLTIELRQASDNCSVLQPEQKLQAMAEAYLAYADTAPDYFRLLSAYDGGNFQQGIPEELQGELLAQSNCALDLVSQVVADGMALGVFTAGEPRKVAGVLWAALNGALALLAHPVRRSMVPATREDFYRATLEMCLQGMGCPCASPPAPAGPLSFGMAESDA